MSNFSLRVIVLEDHSFQRAFAVNLLQQLGCTEVFQAADGAEALAILNEVGPVDIALCDLRMEGMDGLAFLQAVGHSGLVGSVIISSSLSADLRRTVRQIISLLNLELLGDIGKPLHYETLERLLKKHHSVPRTGTLPEQPRVLPDESQVRQALADRGLCAFFQPKFILETGEVTGVEVLARWREASGKVLSPAFFMPVLERCGLLNELLFQQLHESLALQQQLKAFGHELDFAFNLHATQLTDETLATRIHTLLVEYGVRGSSLTFELTESGLLQAPETSLECLFRLRMMGCQLSIDDFGAGFSSLQRLYQLPFNEIKLDGEFARAMMQEPRCHAVVSSTLALGEKLGMSVVVEGIETDEQRQHLLNMGCTQGQGYWYARPMSGGDLVRWLDETQPRSQRA
ncbi:EAL domain-containing response regulator [Pseudomonas sp. B21-056]|jgi:EAL domain-containing protein (putative c-di-GMP-specific phosphodiesterase class I)/DNA-binding NarL/FixJ family response regulator|uniref:EAL domain-containing response regulator n=1 Tax=Pseudomonas sp. B21-056 TaxID=2895495 RepID=UPI0022329E95|nr:EAL domain-containing response regulator [Pseudomonas sp. B21-056]UZE26239.1 EAL domain-containing response regulator [Pseudomonas sp. B21-056]